MSDASTDWRVGMPHARVVVVTLDGCKGWAAEDGSVLIGKCQHKVKPRWGVLTAERCATCPFRRFGLVVLS
jgi:hypothetical protein